MNLKHDLGMSVREKGDGRILTDEEGMLIDRRSAPSLEGVVLDSARNYERMMPIDIDHQLGGLRERLNAEGKPNYEINAELIVYLAGFYDVASQLNPATLAHVKNSVKIIAGSSCRETGIIKKNSLLDGLTGLFLRKYFDKEVLDNKDTQSDEGRHGQLGLEVRMARRAREYHQEDKKEEGNLSLVLVDIDYFKWVNDEHGHPVGDKVLTRVAHLIKTSVREGDHVFRYGGEEIAIIARQTSPEGACVLAEKLRKVIYEDRELFDLVNGERYISASFGVANYTAHVSDPFTMVWGRAQFAKPIHEVVDGFVRAVDKALYAAKNSGRNCVVSYNIPLEIERNAGGEMMINGGQNTVHPPQTKCKNLGATLAHYAGKTAAVFGSLIALAANYVR